MNNNVELSDLFSDISTSIKTKSGKQNGIKPINFASEIDNIKNGVSIKNGKLQQFKASTVDIPEGTFVKLDSNISSTTTSSLFGARSFKNVLMLNDNYAIILHRSSSGSYDSKLSLLQISPSIKRIYTLTLTDYENNNDAIYLHKLKNNKFMVASGGYRPITQLFEVVSDTIILLAKVTKGNITNHNNVSIMSTYAREDNNYWYCYYFFSSTGTNYSGTANYYYLCETISKSDYSTARSAITTIATQSSSTWVYPETSIYTINNKVYLVYVIDGTAEISECSFSGTSITLNRNIQDGIRLANFYRPELAYINNKMFLIYNFRDNSDNLYYTEIIYNEQTNKYTNNGGVLLYTKENEITPSMKNRIVSIDNKAILICNSWHYNYMVLSYDETQNKLIASSPIQIGFVNNSGDPNLSIINCFSDSRLFVFVGGDTTYIAQLDGNIINSLERDAITVSQSIGTIQGLAMTRCTTSTAGDVYVLGAPLGDISLLGDFNINIYGGDTYVEPGYIAKDFDGNDITEEVQVQSDLDTTTLGTYTITYSLNTTQGLISKTRTVNVVDPYEWSFSGETTFIQDGTYTQPTITLKLKKDNTDISSSITITDNTDITTAGDYTVNAVSSYISSIPTNYSLNIKVVDADSVYYNNYEDTLDGGIGNLVSSTSSSGSPLISNDRAVSGTKSLKLNGSSYVQYNLDNLTEFELEFSFYKSDTAAYPRMLCLLGLNREIEVKGSSNSMYINGEVTAGWLQNEWNTFKITRDSNNLITYYCNGNSIKTETSSTAISGIRLGAGSSTGSNVFGGYIDDIRIIKLN